MIARSRFDADPTFGKRRSRGGRTANRCLRGTSETAAFSFRYGESFVRNEGGGKGDILLFLLLFTGFLTGFYGNMVLCQEPHELPSEGFATTF